MGKDRLTSENTETETKKTEKLTKSQLMKKQRMKRKLSKVVTIAVVAVLVAALVAAVVIFAMSITPSLSSTVSVKSQYFDLDNGVVAYLLFGNYNNYVYQYQSVVSLLGLDTSTSLKLQNATDDMTWFQFFLSSTETQIQQLIALASKAKEDGIDLDKDDKASIEEQLETVRGYAKTYGYTTDAYLAAAFCEGVTEKSVRTALELETLAQKYVAKMYEGYSNTTEEYEQFVKDNPGQFYSADYISYIVKADVSSSSTDEQKTEAMAAAKEKADALAENKTLEDFKNAIFEILSAEEEAKKEAAKVDEKTEVTTLTEEELHAKVDNYVKNAKYASSDDTDKWMFDESRKEGDTYVEESTSLNQYTVYMIIKPSYMDKDSMTKNVRHILFDTTTYETDEKAKAKAEEILKQWQDGAKTEESFAELADEYTTDTGSKGNGGLYEDVYVGQMVAEFNDWCFDKARKAGDAEIVKTSYGYHIMYFVGDGETKSWEKVADDGVKDDKYQSDVEKFVGLFPVTFDEKKLDYIPGT